MKAAWKSCSSVLAMQIEALMPNVVIAKGTEAVNSLYEIGIIKNNWSVIRHHFSKGAYREEIESWKGLEKFVICCTYHTSARVVNQTLSKAYDPTETEQFIKRETSELPSSHSVTQFLSAHSNPESNSRAAGMRFLLNHWLDIGAEIRNQSNAKT